MTNTRAGSSLATREVSEGYDRIAHRIGLSRSFYRALMGFARSVEEPILDIGCGGGHLLQYLREEVPKG